VMIIIGISVFVIVIMFDVTVGVADAFVSAIGGMVDHAC